MGDRREIDPHSGVETTGHEWDGIRELNKPLPKWWLYVFYVSILFSIGYWALFPAWPTLTGYTAGVLGFSQRQAAMDDVAAGKAQQAALRAELASKSPEDILRDPKLTQFAIAGGRAAFGDNCAGCHGRGAQGGEGYPNLNDDDWLWGGALSDIHRTILHGVRNGGDEARDSAMPRFGLDNILSDEEISDAAEYVLRLSGRGFDAAAAERGEALYAANCAACHGDVGTGNRELGAPNLADAIWLYGCEKTDIVASIRTGRGGVMPGWAGRLDAETIKKLAIYVHSLGGGEK